MEKVLEAWRNIKFTRELELILKLNNKQKLELYNTVNKENKIQKIKKTLNTIHSVDKFITNRMEKNIDTHEKHWIRKTKKSHVFGHWWKLVASEELTVPEFSAIGADFIRLKYRKSIVSGSWQWDFTIVRTVQKNEFPQLKQISSEFFERDFEDMFFNPNYNLEVEIEWSEQPITMQDVNEKLSWIRNRLALPDENYLKIIKTLCYKTNQYKKTHRSLKTLASQPITLDRQIWHSLNLQDYYISAKADGIRGWLYGTRDSIFLITDKITEFAKFQGREFILDCEILDSNKVLAFDCVYYEGENYINKDLQTRLSAVSFVINKYDLQVQAKPVVPIPQSIEKFWQKKHGFLIDGLIFTHKKDYYSVYKWKPPEKMTIDFVAKKHVKNNNYILFVGAKLAVYKNLGLRTVENYNEYFPNAPKFYFPVAFQPSSNPHAYVWQDDNDDNKYDNKIVELGWDFQNNTWKLHKVREDKQHLLEKNISFGNDYTIAVQIYNSFSNPFNVSDLDVRETGYFQQVKSSEYKALTKFNSYVKFQLAEKFHNENIIDLAAGKGQDLFTYHGIGACEILLIDRDKDALDQIDVRKKNLGKAAVYPFKFNPVAKSRIHTMQADLTEDYKKIHKRIKIKFDFSVNAVFMNFALHYFTGSQKNLENIVNLVDSLNTKYFIFTCFNGHEIFKTLQGLKNGEIKDLNKYKIRKLYSDSEFKMGLKISVKHPFTQELYEEYLVDINEVINMFLARGFILTEQSSFSSWQKNYYKYSMKNNRPQLDRMDKMYSALYSYVILQK